jgi:hypothetical protein
MQNLFTGAIVIVGAVLVLVPAVVRILRRRRAVSLAYERWSSTNGMLLAALVLVLGLPMVPIPMLAHHGTSAYDNTKILKLKGTVTSFNWVNPHVSLEWDVKTENGGTEHWVAELTSPGMLTREGWHHDSVKVGEEVTVYVRPAKNGSRFTFFQRVVFADGRPPLADRGGSDEGEAR